jgi:hypothetical protein
MFGFFRQDKKKSYIMTSKVDYGNRCDSVRISLSLSIAVIKKQGRKVLTILNSVFRPLKKQLRISYDIYDNKGSCRFFRNNPGDNLPPARICLQQ